MSFVYKLKQNVEVEHFHQEHNLSLQKQVKTSLPFKQLFVKLSQAR